MSIASKFEEKDIYIIIISLLVSFFLLFNELNKDDYLRAPDAYYYALQADYWATTGKVKIPDSSFIHRVNGVMQKLGMTTETAVRSWIVLSLILLSGAVLFSFRKQKIMTLLLVSIWILISPSLLFVAIEFPKLFAFLILVPLFNYFLFKPPPNNLYALIPLLIAVFIHKAAIPIVGILVGLLLLDNYRLFFNNQKNIIIVITAIVISIALYFLLGDHFHILDLARLGGTDNLSPGFITLLNRETLPISIKIELIVTFSIFISVVIWYLKTQKIRLMLVMYCLALMLPGFFPFSSNEVFGIGERYAIFLPYFFVLSSLFLGLQKDIILTIKPAITMTLLIGVLTISAIWRLSYSHPLSLDPDYKSYSNVTESIKSDEIPMLIVHRGFNFYYKFKTHKESFHYEPENHWDKKTIWRLIYNITADELDYYLPKSCNWNSGLVKSVKSKEYYLIREDCWFGFRQKIDIDKDEDLYNRTWRWWRNPSKHRPAFLYLKHKDDVGNKLDAFSAFK